VRGACDDHETFINLPARDLAKATEFFSKIGFSFDSQFTDENATRMIISDDTSVMLSAEPTFKGSSRPLATTPRTRLR
jgi:uncharacterized protein